MFFNVSFISYFDSVKQICFVNHKASCFQLKLIAEIITIINRKLAKLTADVIINVGIAKKQVKLIPMNDKKKQRGEKIAVRG